jgi:hypothetical protein
LGAETMKRPFGITPHPCHPPCGVLSTGPLSWPSFFILFILIQTIPPPKNSRELRPDQWGAAKGPKTPRVKT